MFFWHVLLDELYIYMDKFLFVSFVLLVCHLCSCMAEYQYYLECVRQLLLESCLFWSVTPEIKAVTFHHRHTHTHTQTFTHPIILYYIIGLENDACWYFVSALYCMGFSFKIFHASSVCYWPLTHSFGSK